MKPDLIKISKSSGIKAAETKCGFRYKIANYKKFKKKKGVVYIFEDYGEKAAFKTISYQFSDGKFTKSSSAFWLKIINNKLKIQKSNGFNIPYPETISNRNHALCKKFDLKTSGREKLQINSFEMALQKRNKHT